MKKVLFTLIYPFWFFLSKTWIGGVLMICLVPVIPAVLINLIFPNIINFTKEEAERIGLGIAIFCLLISPFTGMLLMRLGFYLESHYDIWEYKTEIKTKMI